MNKQNEENLGQLLSRFFAADQAGQVEEDIRAGEKILGLYPTPQPKEAIVASIKAQITESLSHRKTTMFRHAVYKAVAIAAVLVFSSIISLQWATHQHNANKIALIPAAVWESEEIAVADEELSILTAEIEQIKEEIDYLHANGYSDSYSAIAELEMELIEIDSDFWKG